MNTISNTMESTRIDKWLWAARFFKTRSLATHAIELGRVLQNEQRVKPAHNVKAGDMIEVHLAEQVWTVRVQRILDKRGSASIAQTMYEETAASKALREQVAESKKYYREPSAQLTGRPTKRDRRLIDFTRS
ncbi:RNA-binding S4 domain-containing protein [Undibacterium sp. SXout7W]|uniref:RNA-binding S4 domain-containing protein n=1 Tax=Undibacterium sp. SXout7W TaxID=3413049 RepID=UPI003BEFBAAB